MKYKVLKKGTRWNTGKRVYVLDDPVQLAEGLPKDVFEDLVSRKIISGKETKNVKLT